MVREDILGGLSSALARGQSLKQAMMSFYNAGYVKEEIETAAKALNSSITSQPLQTQQTRQVVSQQPLQQIPSQTIQKVSAYGTQQPQQPLQQQILQKQPQLVQNISAYGQAQKPKGKLAIFVLVFLLMILLGALATVFFFKNEILAFFSG